MFTLEELRILEVAMIRFQLQGYPYEKRLGWKEKEQWQVFCRGVWLKLEATIKQMKEAQGTRIK